MSKSHEIFPKNESFETQEKFVNSLPSNTKNDAREKAIQIIQSKESPFTALPNELPKNIKITMYHHSITKTSLQVTQHDNDSDDDSDNEKESKMTSTDAIVKRKLRLSSTGKKTEKITVHVPSNNKNSDDSTTFAITFNDDGSLKGVSTSTESLSTLTKGLDQSNKNGTVIIAQEIEGNNAGKLYSAYKKK